MENYIIGILGGFIGSTLTVLITKSLEILQKSKEHKYNFQTLFFNKKLAAAETTVMQYSLFSDTLCQLRLLYSRYEEYDTYIGNQLNDNLLKQIEEKIKIANHASMSLANSISLYFDLTSSFSKNQIISEFYDTLNSLGPYYENVEKTFDQYLSFIGTENEKETYEIYQTSEKYLGIAMENVALGYEKFDIELNKQIQQIRNEMKKFEY